MKEVYVFGHKKPDTDSVTSALALAYLKNQLGIPAKPYILDSMNPETEFVLKYFGIETPKILNDVKLKIDDIDYYRDFYVLDTTSILKAYETIKANNVTAVPVINENKKLLGLITLKMIANELISGNFNKIETSYDNLLETLNAKEIQRCDEVIKGNIIVGAYGSTTFIENIKIDNKTILIVGNRKKVIDYALNNKTKLMIIAGGNELTEEQLELAKKNKVNVISTPNDTFHTVKLIGVCSYIRTLLGNARIERVTRKDELDALLEISSKQGYNNYPVVYENGKCAGLVRVTDIRKKYKKKVILVDHNEQDQSVPGLEQAEIIEIVDHHKIGDLSTNKPINFRNMNVGSTNTIIYLMFSESGIKIPKEIAGIMFSGIISDTLNFTSPTTTNIDIEVAGNLEKIAQIDRNEYARKMFEAGTNIDGKTVREIIKTDLKVFQVEDERIAVSQVLTLSADKILARKKEYIEEMEQMQESKGYSMIVMYITDIVKKGSFVLYSESAKKKLEIAMGVDNIHQGIYRDGILSRKKQIIPRLMKTIKRELI